MNGPDPVLAAAAALDITPPPGLRMGGYVARGAAPATGAHDPLEAAIVWLRQGAADVVWVALDALDVKVQEAGAVARAVSAELGCETGAVHVTATHTHSGPADYGAGLVPALAEAAARLRGRLEPVRISFAEGRVEGLGSNRNDPAGPCDPSLGVLSLLDEQGGIVAAVVDHGCHPTVLGHDNVQWSADWPGAARRVLREALRVLAPAAPAEAGAARTPVVAMLQGASGDVSARFTRRAQSFSEVDRLGGLAAARALEVLLAQLDPQATPRIASARAVLQVPTRRLPDVEVARSTAAGLEKAWRTVCETAGPGPEERIARTRHEGAVVALQMAERGLPPHLSLPIAAVSIGETAWIELPVELFTGPALQIRSGSPFRRTRVVGLAGGSFGYLADRAAHQAGVYEALASPFGPEAVQTVTAGALELLEALHARSREESWATATR